MSSLVGVKYSYKQNLGSDKHHYKELLDGAYQLRRTGTTSYMNMIVIEWSVVPECWLGVSPHKNK